MPLFEYFLWWYHSSDNFTLAVVQALQSVKLVVSNVSLLLDKIRYSDSNQILTGVHLDKSLYTDCKSCMQFPDSLLSWLYYILENESNVKPI